MLTDMLFLSFSYFQLYWFNVLHSEKRYSRTSTQRQEPIAPAQRLDSSIIYKYSYSSSGKGGVWLTDEKQTKLISS